VVDNVLLVKNDRVESVLLVYTECAKTISYGNGMVQMQIVE